MMHFLLGTHLGNGTFGCVRHYLLQENMYDNPSICTHNIHMVTISNQRVYGLMGTVADLQPEVIIVNFHTINKHLRIQRHTFTNYSKQERKNIGTRIQFPLELAFALTLHKAQGLTLDRVCIDCRL